LSDGDKKIFNLKRTGCGFPYSFPIIQDYFGSCDNPAYYFRWKPVLESFSYNDSKTIVVEGGVGDFSWSLYPEDSVFSLDNATTSERTNTVRTDFSADIGDSVVVTVEDSCGNSVSGILKVCSCISDADKGYVQQEDFLGVARSAAVAASVETSIYVGLGGGPAEYLKDWWQYNLVTDGWTQKADFGGGIRYGALAVACGTKIYAGFGSDHAHSRYGDWWKYDTETDIWTQKASTIARTNLVGATYGTKIYVGMGGEGTAISDWWEYDTETDTWTQKAIFDDGLGRQRSGAVCARLGAYIYVGLGHTIYAGYQYLKDWWRYDPGNDTWLQRANCVIDSGLYVAIAVALNEKIYIGTGMTDGGDQSSSKDWMRSYDPDTNTWAEEDAFSGGPRNSAVAASAGGAIFMGTGYYTSRLNDWWRYIA